MRNIVTVIAFVTALLFSTTTNAQSSAVKKAGESVFTLTTFNADGSIHGSSYGVFVGQGGEGIAMWHHFVGADRAVVIDSKGKSHDIDVMMGVSELYDICQFRIKDKAANGLSLAKSNESASPVYLSEYSLKKVTPKKVVPQRTEKFMETYNYYVFNDVDVSNTDLGCPVVNGQGELLGIMQRPVNGGQAFSTDARIITTFKLNGLSLNDQTLRATGIRTALPTDENQATLTLMLSGQQTDSAKYQAYLNDYIEMYPTSSVGYKSKGESYVGQRNLKLADEVFKQSVKNTTKKDEAYYDYAQAMYRAVVFKADTTYTDWSFDQAMKLSQEAEKLNPLPIYKHLQAQILFAQGKYQQALDIFTALQKTDLGKNGEVFFEAAQSKMQLKAPKEEIMALLDSAVNVQPGSTSAPYVLARGRVFDASGEYRKAFLDYLAYDTLMNNRASHDFYYTKYKCEMKLRQYQLALEDIAHAIVLNRFEPTYYAEMASLQLLINKPEDAIKTCDMGLLLTQEYSDLFIIKGIAQCETKDKAAGIATLQKAKDLGDSRAPSLIEKYSK
ncbi:MAG: serine protease [Prevotella sp.]|nr:serine protease [Prevotella sp.]